MSDKGLAVQTVNQSESEKLLAGCLAPKELWLKIQKFVKAVGCWEKFIEVVKKQESTFPVSVIPKKALLLLIKKAVEELLSSV